MYYLKTEVGFDAAHFLKNYNGKCHNLHGHRWRVIATAKSKELLCDKQKEGMVMDFSDLKKALKEVTDRFDHSLIYEKDSLKNETVKALLSEDFKLVEVDFRTTAENFSKYFFDELKKYGFDMHQIEVYETPNNCAMYSE
ncbi:6-pyruvoyltetrahydropterin/6-carboxytetrahydropterin synthase [Acetitomaculum ruminis DSM 5522]|uniref:6-carboxy-5,6,7,8-tetrahydropterin synthase n=1 Tax=Acetitomaculum ruminis DSM 5522 TaxID=1120918 RepID=A0A1I0YW75_9FIRM|nr:6-carboxytetrahydropterin synthase QueD [Acetitomaculum ruminis]SFB16640.1 6-pyruvoyltetrahydropterin/6-carboxytetrahydropterin synthase [Acetitomaculum ruminis DSM 5522]